LATEKTKNPKLLEASKRDNLGQGQNQTSIKKGKEAAKKRFKWRYRQPTVGSNPTSRTKNLTYDVFFKINHILKPIF
jgi:hypothetical protein